MSSKYGYDDLYNDEDALNEDESRSLYGDIEAYWADQVNFLDEIDGLYDVESDDNIEEF